MEWEFWVLWKECPHKRLPVFSLENHYLCFRCVLEKLLQGNDSDIIANTEFEMFDWCKNIGNSEEMFPIKLTVHGWLWWMSHRLASSSCTGNQWLQLSENAKKIWVGEKKVEYSYFQGVKFLFFPIFLSILLFFLFLLAISSYFSYFLAILLTISKYLLKIWTF